MFWKGFIVTAPYDLDTLRREFPITQQLTYLNHASISPVPLRTQTVMDRVNEWLVCDPQALFTGGAFGDIFATFSSEIARFFNADQMHEVVGVTSTSAALNAIAQSIEWHPGDNLVFVDVEFPSNANPWMVLERRGVEVRLATAIGGGAAVENLDAQVDDHTRLIAVSAVQFLTGHRADLAAIGTYCRERGIIFVVDAIQAAGHIPIDVQAMKIDILAAGGQKSLMGPPGQGFLYVWDDICCLMQPGIVGPNAVEGWEHWLHYDLTPRQGAFRFMMGTPNITGMVGLVESIRFLGELGIENIDAWTKHLSSVAIEDLTRRGYDVITLPDPVHLGPIVTFRVGGPEDDPKANVLVQQLYEQGVRVTKHLDAGGAPHLRISTHCYNTEEEVLRVGLILGDL
jgi:selenocysteine lyase/cysteine desulfurase